MGSLGLLVEACKTCDDSYSENDDEVGDKEQQNLNSNILYCKARRMPFDHVKENAILLFASGEERAHGAELQCSHPICREKGIKFRYCAPCEKAVAKRNFRKRHAHSEPIKTYDANKRKPLRIIYPGDVQNNQHVKSSPTHREETIHTEALGLNHESGYFINETYRPTFQLNHTNSTNFERLRSTIMHVPQPWIDLFHERPLDGDKDQIKMWLVRAMDIADLSTNVQHPISSNILKTERQSIAYDPVTAVREEFTGVVPPRYMSFEKTEQHLNSNTANLGEHAAALPLHIKTELDEVASSSIMLDSKGSIIITPNAL